MRNIETSRCTAEWPLQHTALRNNYRKISQKRRISADEMYSVSQKKSPPAVFWNFFQNGFGLLINFLHTYYAIISTLEYKFLFKYLQLRQSYAILSATT